MWIPRVDMYVSLFSIQFNVAELVTKDISEQPPKSLAPLLPSAVNFFHSELGALKDLQS